MMHVNSKMTHTNDQSETMERNLQNLIRNQSYFSCFVPEKQSLQQPLNPFEKKVFDKNLRKSCVSLGHYNSSSNISSRNQNQNHPSVYRSQVSSIITHFRQELDYLELKLNDKIMEYQEKVMCGQMQQDKKQMELTFMVENLDKVLGFMIENCLNLQDHLIVGQHHMDNSRHSINTQKSTNINSKHNKNNINNITNKYHLQVQTPTQRTQQSNKKKIKRIVEMEQKSIFSNQSSNKLPNRYLIIENDSKNSSNKQNHQNNILINKSVNKQTMNKSKNQQIKCNKKLNKQVCKYGLHQQEGYSHQKSIYQSVLQERSRRIKTMRKKVI